MLAQLDDSRHQRKKTEVHLPQQRALSRNKGAKWAFNGQQRLASSCTKSRVEGCC
ncbi:hypothetical protein [Gallibacterium anatis]|uniref:hypothetical protein n=1 Tax=Gallibacterium anatis TaxID=750 RepID=UPI003003B44E